MPSNNNENAGESRPGLTKLRQPGLIPKSKPYPVLSILLLSLLTIVINCYPVIFCGKSFVSPSSVGSDIYDWPPWAPGAQSNLLVMGHGSDTGALMWSPVPTAFIESRSLFQHWELPLWNRYTQAGETLIGETTSMFGDPLHFIVLFGHGAAWAWDIKFLAAKFIFCAGFGFLVFRLTGSRPLSLIYAALGAYCGVYFYFNNHPTLFVFAYTPWILLSAIGMLDLQSPRGIRWLLTWVLANFCCFNAGQIEPAVTLMGGLNLVALANALVIQHGALAKGKVLGRMVIGTLLLLGLCAPWWLSFLGALQGSYSTHMKVHVSQLPLAVIPGLFDDIFYQMASHRLHTGADAIAPGTSMLVLVGCIFSVLRWKQLRTDSFFWANMVAVLLWSGCIFGWVPIFLIVKIPFFNQVGHTSRDFSYLLIIHLTLQSAYGFKCMAEKDSLQKAIRDLAFITGIIMSVIVGYWFLLPFVTMQWSYLLEVTAAAILAPLLFVVLNESDLQKEKKSERQYLAAWVMIVILGFIPQYRFAFYNLGDQANLMLPGPRVKLDSPSPAIQKIKTDASGPFRVTGVGKCLIGDSPAIYELEDIRSCEPLSNGEFFRLVSNFPGMQVDWGWLVEVVDPSKAQPLLNLLNVKYILDNPSKPIQVPTDFQIVDRSDFLVSENPEKWPRAFFSSRVIPISSNDDFIKYLMKNRKQPFIAMTNDEIAVQPGLKPLETVLPSDIIPATNYRLLPNSTSFNIHASSAGIVCLTEGQAKDFYAKVNNKNMEILTVNCAFKGLYLDKPGDYHIEFSFQPQHWQMACILFWISVCATFILAVTPQFFMTHPN